MSVEIGSLRSDVEADRYGCIAAIGFDRAYQRAMTVRIRRSSISCESRSSWMRTRSGRYLAAFFQRACRKSVAALRAVDEMNVIRIDR